MRSLVTVVACALLAGAADAQAKTEIHFWHAMSGQLGEAVDELVRRFNESQAEFDLLKARKGYFRSWDHQLMQEAYPFTVKPKGQAKDKWDFLQFGAAVPAANQPLELLAPTKEQNTCKM